jgi:hypothetical protein
MALLTFTIADIKSWEPSLNAQLYLKPNWSGNVLDILRAQKMPPDDRLLIVLREYLIDAPELRTFAVWCARQVENLANNANSSNALLVAEKFIKGEVSEAELAEAERLADLAADDVPQATIANAGQVAAMSSARTAAADATLRNAEKAAIAASQSAAFSQTFAGSVTDIGLLVSLREQQIKQLIKIVEKSLK